MYGDSQAQKDAETLAHHRSLRHSVSAALRALHPEERQFLRMKYGLDDGKAKTTRCVFLLGRVVGAAAREHVVSCCVVGASRGIYVCVHQALPPQHPKHSPTSHHASK